MPSFMTQPRTRSLSTASISHILAALTLSVVSFAQNAPTEAPAQTTPPPAPVPAQTPAQPAAAQIETPDIVENLENFFTLFTPLRTDRAAISPDGKHIAYTVREGETLNVVIVETDNPGVLKTVAVAGTDESSTPSFSELSGRIPAAINWMKWVNNNRLVWETNGIAVIDFKNYPGAVMAIDADGSNGGVLVTARDIKENDMIISETTSPSSSDLQPDSTGLESITFSSNDFLAGTTDPFESAFAENLETTGTTTVTSVINSLSPHIFDLCPGEADTIYIRANSPTRHHIYKLNVTTKKLKYTQDRTVTPDTNPLLNRQCLPLLTVNNSFRNRFPFSYIYEKNAGPFGRTSLDKIAATGDKEKASGFTLSPDNYFGHRSIPIGFDENPEILYYASNLNRDTYGIYSLNLKTGQKGAITLENPNADLITPANSGFTETSPLIYDRYTRQLMGLRIDGMRPMTRWLNPSWQTLQNLLEKNLRGHVVDIVDWDETATKFIILARNIVDPGAFYFFDARTAQLVEFARRSAEIKDAPDTLPIPFRFDVPNPNDAPNGRITGTIIIPRRARTATLPVVVYCPPEPWLQPTAEYQAEIRALADMGFAIVQVKTRGTWGSGAQNRENTIHQGFDLVQTQDIVAALDRLQQYYKINLKRVAIMGSARGSYLAMRAAQIHPDRFKCVVAINPTVNLASWISSERWTTGSTAPALTRSYYGTAEQLKKSTLSANVDSAKSPVLMLAYPGPQGAERRQEYLDAVNYSFALKRRNIPAEVYELSDDYMAGIMKARSETFSKIETWLNEYIYRYQVDLGEMQRVGEPPPVSTSP